MTTITTQLLRERFEQMSSVQLQRVLQAPEGEYTPEALEVARDVLAHRPAEQPTPVSEEPEPASHKGEGWAVIGAIVAAGHLSRLLFRAWRTSEQSPEVLRHAMHDLVASPWTYVIGVAGAVWLWRRRA